MKVTSQLARIAFIVSALAAPANSAEDSATPKMAAQEAQSQLRSLFPEMPRTRDSAFVEAYQFYQEFERRHARILAETERITVALRANGQRDSYYVDTILSAYCAAAKNKKWKEYSQGMRVPNKRNDFQREIESAYQPAMHSYLEARAKFNSLEAAGGRYPSPGYSEYSEYEAQLSESLGDESTAQFWRQQKELPPNAMTAVANAISEYETRTGRSSGLALVIGLTNGAAIAGSDQYVPLRNGRFEEEDVRQAKRDARKELQNQMRFERSVQSLSQ